MPHVIAEPCIGSKDQSCVDVCPVDCIHPTRDEPAFAESPQLYIDPTECIDCTACVAACPVDACLSADELPSRWRTYEEINSEYYRSLRTRERPTLSPGQPSYFACAPLAT